MKKLLGMMIYLLLSASLFPFEELKGGISERKCGTATKKGFTHPQFPTYKMNCETFEHIIGSWYKDKEDVYFYKDVNSMYVGFEVIDGMDPEKVKPIGESLEIYYISDGKKIYVQKGFYMAGIIENVNMKTFEILENGYSKDSKKVYYLTTELENPDVKTFKVLNKFYAKDKNNVYYKNEKVLGADTKTFKVLTFETSYGEDKNIGFEYGKMILPPRPID